MNWFCIEIESKNFNRSGAKAELIYSSLQLTVIGVGVRLPEIRLPGAKTRRKISHR
jgi:hypothetical protein